MLAAYILQSRSAAMNVALISSLSGIEHRVIGLAGPDAWKPGDPDFRLDMQIGRPSCSPDVGPFAHLLLYCLKAPLVRHPLVVNPSPLAGKAPVREGTV